MRRISCWLRSFLSPRWIAYIVRNAFASYEEKNESRKVKNWYSLLRLNWWYAPVVDIFPLSRWLFRALSNANICVRHFFSLLRFVVDPFVRQKMHWMTLNARFTLENIFCLFDCCRPRTRARSVVSFTRHQSDDHLSLSHRLRAISSSVHSFRLTFAGW